MDNQKNHGGSLILIELMIALFFFAISGAIVLQIFVKAHQLSTSAQERTQAWNLSSQAAELIESGIYDEAGLKEEFPILYVKGDTYECYFDKNWKISSRDNGCYSMRITMNQKESLVKGNIKVAKGKKELYQLNVEVYQPERRSYEET